LLFAFCRLLFVFPEGCFGDAEADIIVAVIRLVVVANGALHVLWLIVPPATTERTISVCPYNGFMKRVEFDKSCKISKKFSRQNPAVRDFA
jgi:hypothetical protein